MTASSKCGDGAQARQRSRNAECGVKPGSRYRVRWCPPPAVNRMRRQTSPDCHKNVCASNPQTFKSNAGYVLSLLRLAATRYQSSCTSHAGLVGEQIPSALHSSVWDCAVKHRNRGLIHHFCSPCKQSGSLPATSFVCLSAYTLVCNQLAVEKLDRLSAAACPPLLLCSFLHHRTILVSPEIPFATLAV